ncbi:tyrosine-type recombinase/integrase [Microvirga sp. RSM25]|uniref:tyrosine-type recombinase/integrase n=1 Tax=Microvirga sp. RSM25 TaxID=3273802 RepID=UPI00384D88A1
MRFTKQSIAALALPAGKPYMIEWDNSLPGFGIRINEGGSRVWVVQYRAGGKSKRETVGRVDAIPLDDARKLAKATLAKVHLGADPHAERAADKARSAFTLEAVSEKYLRRAKAKLKPRSYEEVERHLNRHWSTLKALPIHKIRRADVALRLEEIASEHGPFASNRARASLSALFSWAMGEGLAEANPVIGTNKTTDEVSRDHHLTPAELAAVWSHCRDDDYGRIVRLLMLTAQRREEVAAMSWGEFDERDGLWSIPKGRTKNGLPHDVPLSAPAIDTLNSATRREGRALVFGEGAGGFKDGATPRRRLISASVRPDLRCAPGACMI